MTYFLALLISFFSNSAQAGEAINKAFLESGIKSSDSLETKIDKALFLLNEQRYDLIASGKVNSPPTCRFTAPK